MKLQKKKAQKQLKKPPARKVSTVLSRVGEAARIRKAEAEEYDRLQKLLPVYMRDSWEALPEGSVQINDLEYEDLSSRDRMTARLIELGRAVCGDRGLNWMGHRRG